MSPGELFALGAAMTWAMAVILFKLSGERMPPLALNLFKTTLSLVLLIVTLFFLGEPLLPDRPVDEYVVLLLSGIIGITLSDTLFFYGLNRLGAGLNSIVECLYSPSIILLSFLFLPDATLTLADATGLALILAALFLIASPRSGGAERKDLAVGIACGATAMVSLAVGVMLFIPIVKEVSVFWASAVRTFGAVLTLAALPLLRRDARHLFDCFRPSRVWWWSIPGSILGTYVALLFWTLGFKHASSSRAAILNQSNTIFVLILATIFLRESITRRKVIAITLGIGGVVVVSLLGSGREDADEKRPREEGTVGLHAQVEGSTESDHRGGSPGLARLSKRPLAASGIVPRWPLLGRVVCEGSLIDSRCRPILGRRGSDPARRRIRQPILRVRRNSYEAGAVVRLDPPRRVRRHSRGGRIHPLLPRR